VHPNKGAQPTGKEHPMVRRFQCKYHQTSDIGRWGRDSASPAVAGLAAYFLSLEQYRVRLLVPGSVARNVRDLIKSLAYARLPLQPAVAWNGIDSRQHPCPAAARRDAAQECPALNTTQPIVPPNPTTPSHPKVTVPPSSNNLPSSIGTTDLSTSSTMTAVNDPPSITSAFDIGISQVVSDESTPVVT
jgi:hypothetical protein